MYVIASGHDDITSSLKETNWADDKFEEINQNNLLNSIDLTIHIYITLPIINDARRWLVSTQYEAVQWACTCEIVKSWRSLQPERMYVVYSNTNKKLTWNNNQQHPNNTYINTLHIVIIQTNSSLHFVTTFIALFPSNTTHFNSKWYITTHLPPSGHLQAVSECVPCCYVKRRGGIKDASKNKTVNWPPASRLGVGSVPATWTRRVVHGRRKQTRRIKL